MAKNKKKDPPLKPNLITGAIRASLGLSPQMGVATNDQGQRVPTRQETLNDLASRRARQQEEGTRNRPAEERVKGAYEATGRRTARVRQQEKREAQPQSSNPYDAGIKRTQEGKGQQTYGMPSSSVLEGAMPDPRGKPLQQQVFETIRGLNAGDPFLGADPTGLSHALTMLFSRPARQVPKAIDALLPVLDNTDDLSRLTTMRGWTDRPGTLRFPSVTNTPHEFVAYDPSNPLRSAPITGRYQLEAQPDQRLVDILGETLGGNWETDLVRPHVNIMNAGSDLGESMRGLLPAQFGPVAEPTLGELLRGVVDDPKYGLLDALHYHDLNPHRYQPLEEILRLPPSDMIAMTAKGSPTPAQTRYHQGLAGHYLENVNDSWPARLTAESEAFSTAIGGQFPELSLGDLIRSSATNSAVDPLMELGMKRNPQHNPAAIRELQKTVDLGSNITPRQLDLILANVDASLNRYINSMGGIGEIPIADTDYIWRQLMSNSLDNFWRSRGLGLTNFQP